LDCRPPRGMVSHTAVHFDLAPNVPPHARDVHRRAPYQVRLSHGLALPLYTELGKGHPIENHLAELVEAWHSRSPLGRLRASSLLLRVLMLLLQRGESPPYDRHVPRMERAIRFIRERHAQELSMPDMADAAGLSRAHFARVFTEWTGQSPGAFLQQVRVEAARSLLSNPEIPIKQIAPRVGFKNPYHFSRVFRRIEGISPQQYRETLGGSTRAKQ